MREKELRLAVVLTGGVSLVVYMFGVAVELLKLVRASRAFHDRDAAEGGLPERYPEPPGDGGRETDTEAVYFDLLRALAPKLDLRVIVDVISGASAGGVNGIMLARALAHDLALETHREMWLEHADVLDLIDEQASAKRWSKLYVAPVVGILMRGRLRALAPEKETRRKLLTFLRSRWFSPPFSGPRFATWLLDACQAMERGSRPDGSLLPDGHALDLFVSATDFHGHVNRLPLHDPPEIDELDHRHVMHFGYLSSPGGVARSDFDMGAVPGLVFAARATSCFPGAFPPASLAEIDALAADRGQPWPARERFLADKLGSLARGGRDLKDVRLIDGSVVNDKPFGAAIAAVAGRPAHREVTRRILFIQADPAEASVARDAGEPGFFRTILASLAEIPRNEPIHDDLARVDSFNKHIRLVRQVVSRTEPMIEPFVAAILPSGGAFKPTQGEIAAWRGEANEQAAASAGYAFQSYFRLKLLTIVDRLDGLVADLAWPGTRGIPADARIGFRAALGDYGVADIGHGGAVEPGAAASLGEIDFLKAFDVDFRVRRLRFVIRRLNELYQQMVERPELASSTDRLDELKTTLYGLLDDVKRRWDAGFYAASVVEGVADTGHPVGRLPEVFGIALSRIAEGMALVELDEAIDEVFSVMVLNYIPEALRRDLFTAYVGFSFFDVMSFPMVQWEDLDEFQEILIDRISPQDAVAIHPEGTSEMLRGTALRRFGGFFNRGYRENDYLWGRLNAAERLVDIVLDAASTRDGAPDVDAAALKRRLFLAILDAEEPFLGQVPDLVRGLRREVTAG